jgi:hypothetical protein
METDMDDLRARVAQPALVGDVVPLEVQMESIMEGVKMLREGYVKTKVVGAAMKKQVLESPVGY